MSLIITLLSTIFILNVLHSCFMQICITSNNWSMPFYLTNNVTSTFLRRSINLQTGELSLIPAPFGLKHRLICVVLCFSGLSFYSFETLKDMMLEYFPEVAGRPCPHREGDLVLVIPAKLFCGGLAGALAQTIS